MICLLVLTLYILALILECIVRFYQGLCLSYSLRHEFPEKSFSIKIIDNNSKVLNLKSSKNYDFSFSLTKGFHIYCSHRHMDKSFLITINIDPNKEKSISFQGNTFQGNNINISLQKVEDFEWNVNWSIDEMAIYGMISDNRTYFISRAA
jgi:hypothetical protein